MPAVGYSIFDTALGCCGIAWGERGVVAVQLPEADAAQHAGAAAAAAFVLRSRRARPPRCSKRSTASARC